MNDKKDSVTHTTSLTYVPDSYSFTQQGVNYFSDTVNVPIYNGQAVWGYRIRNGTVSQTTGGSPLNYVVSDSMAIGFTWTQSYDPTAKIYTNAKIENINYSLHVGSKVYSPTIVILFQNSTSIGPVTQPNKRRYYTKDIGFVREELLSVPSGSVMGSLTLQTYFINK
jgi:hypothetical protein